MPGTIYKGKRDNEDVHVTINGKPLRHINYHSPDGFEWGYGGSGPSDLALSILAHHLRETWVNGLYLRKLKITQDAPLCWQFHLNFKDEIISQLNKDEWELTSGEVHNWLASQKKPTEV